jgi:serine/threonine protein kinase
MLNLIGQRVGQYEVLTRFGEGGMATVYRARQLNIKREVAIKVILPNLAQREEFSQRFEKEAQMIASLSNPYIVKVFDYGVLRGFHLRLIDAQVDPRKDIYYLVMELLTGGSLADRIKKGPMPVETVGHILEQMALALDYAHGRGLIHRDLKPPNVLFDDQGNAFLTDFGIAKILSDTTTLTSEGMTVGTPPYMAPEQWESENLGPWTDLYSLGVVLFEMLTGKLPFVAGTPFRVMHMHLYEAPPLPSSILPTLPHGLDSVIQQALAKKPETRFQTSMALVDAFKQAVAGHVSAVPNHPKPIEKAKKPDEKPEESTQAESRARTSQPGSNRLLLLGLIILVAVLLLIVMLLILSNQRTTSAMTEIGGFARMLAYGFS